MRNTLGWMLLLSGTLLAGTGHATDAKGFKGVTLASGSFEDLNLWNHWFLSPPTGRSSHHMHNLWYAHLRTHGTSDLYVQDNTWDPGGSTGWHTHPGASLIIVTQGTVTAYEGDDQECTPHVYRVGDTFVDSEEATCTSSATRPGPSRRPSPSSSSPTGPCGASTCRRRATVPSDGSVTSRSTVGPLPEVARRAAGAL